MQKSGKLVAAFLLRARIMQARLLSAPVAGALLAQHAAARLRARLCYRMSSTVTDTRYHRARYEAVPSGCRQRYTASALRIRKQ
ncbi:hypothetical protein [Cupriavidus sp. AU9028]|uniref:hypothetical protein n=1 Tax=Cupriavidus sp. AU9028 TaxID=2871157 RepID=UPI001C965EBA|nr:hypothetical protein [Cupriavidus sp. AU9028]MBY4896347.1 hypothetical protein [Cupriavidus sp. AU9028]